MSPLKYTCFVDLESYCLKRDMDAERIRLLIVRRIVPDKLFDVMWMVDEKGLEEWGATNPLYRTAKNLRIIPQPVIEKPPGGRG